MERKGWPGTLAVAALLIGLSVGLPAADRSVPAFDVPLPAGTRVQVGPADGARRPVSVQVPDGWAVDVDDTSLSQSVALFNGSTSFQLSVILAEGATPTQLWHGLGRLELAGGVTAQQGQTVPITTEQGVPGLAGPVTFPDRTATVAVFAAPALGADVVVTGPPDEVTGPEIRTMLVSIRFDGAGR
ncbi:hypothetical protein Aph01nite_42460 [Acrocarpospora phusangensis]|uniref:Uncharacterized protein n=1 Tax=Acrocarpospora phusangensis TaxID=1070424 RepID=A0A919ULA0_9ACTN|nr:hypothetical protein [Acrocarpospora phusangensis]GIH25936.1 hypothetical protein Aph01nite_42460 [Acrocarpospora phusangensis]